MKIGTILLIGGALVVGGLALASTAGAQPKTPSGTSMPPNVTIVESKMAAMAQVGLIKHVQAGGAVVTAVYSESVRVAMLESLANVASQVPDVRFVAAPVEFAVANVPAEFSDQVPPGLVWGVAAVLDLEWRYRNLSQSVEVTTQQMLIDALWAAVASITGGPLLEGAGDGVEPLLAWLFLRAQQLPQGPKTPPPPIPMPTEPTGPEGVWLPEPQPQPQSQPVHANPVQPGLQPGVQPGGGVVQPGVMQPGTLSFRRA